MNNISSPTNYFLTITGLTSDDIISIRKLLPSVKVGYTNDNKSSLCMVNLDNEQTVNQIVNAVKIMKLSQNEYGIKIIFVTERDHDGIHFPDHVVKLHHIIGGRIEISCIQHV